MRFLLIICVFLSLACTRVKLNTDSGSEAVVVDTGSSVISKLKLNAGEFIPKINCPGNEDLSFALYVPQQFDTLKKWPVLFLFDAHSDGSLPINKYRDLADTYGYILAGSNNSKNGNSKDQTARIIETIVSSAFQLLPADSTRLYSGGFSGGGRVASMLAFSPAGIRGLVTCGQEFPSTSWTTPPPVCIVGMAGDGDMNLHELSDLKISNPQLEKNFFLVRFDGKHEWPPVEIFEQAFLAFQSEALRSNLIKNDPKAIKIIDEAYSKQVDALAVKRKTLYTASAYDRWIKSLETLTDLTVTKNAFAEFKKKPAYLQAIKEDQTLFAEENQRREFFIEAFGKNDTSWWRQQMNSIQAEMKSSSAERKNMLSRVTGTLSLACYMNLNQVLNANKEDAVQYLSTLYRLIDPENSEAWYLSAVAAARESQLQKVNPYLEKAINSGFNDPNRMRSEQAFYSMSNDPGFNQLLTRISK